MGVTRKLVAILYADVAGYSRLTKTDEIGTHAQLSASLDRISECVEGAGGNVVHYAGDAVPAQFQSTVTAVETALEIQKSLADLHTDIDENRRLRFRIGVNLGEVVVDRDDVYGDGVNVAARLESLAEPGGVCVSDDVYRQVSGKITAHFRDIGEQELKNIPDRVRAYHVSLDPARLTPEVYEALTGEPLELPDKPSIAILPFENMGGDPEQEFFADSMTEDIIAMLSRVADLIVMARNSTFVYKGSAVDVRQVGIDLGVRYVLEGSIRKSGNRIRVTAQLIDAQDRAHVWAERYDRDLDDIFAIQDEITREIVIALQVKLTHGEEIRVWANRAPSVEAWEYVSRAMMEQYKFTREGHLEAKRLARQAVALHPDFPMPRMLLGWVLATGARFGFVKDFDAAVDEAESLTRGLLMEHGHVADGYALLGYVLTNRRDHDGAIAAGERAVELAPNVSLYHGALAISLCFAGEYDAALQRMKKALRLSPYCPDWYISFLGDGYRGIGELKQARYVYEHLASRMPGSLMSQTRLACIYAELEESEKAAEVADRILSIDPAFSVDAFADRAAFKHQEDRDSLVNALLKAGLPE